MASIIINILSNKPPTVSDKTITVDNAGTYVFSSADFSLNYSDPEGDPMGGIIITSLPTSGALILSGIQINSADLPLSISKVDLDNGKLSYSADPNNPNPHETGFIFKICDDRNACQ